MLEDRRVGDVSALSKIPAFRPTPTPRRRRCRERVGAGQNPSISSERVTAGRPVNAQVPVGCSGRPSFGRRLARVGTLIRQTSSRQHLLQRHTCPSASRNHCTRACCAVLAGHNDCVERRRDASTSTNRERSTASRHAEACVCAWRHHRRHTHSFASLHATGFVDLCLLPALSRTRPIRYRC